MTTAPLKVLTGERVVVRVPAPGDEVALVEMATDPRVRRYLGGPKAQGAAEADAARKVGEARWGQFVIVDRAAGVVAGSGSVARKRGPWEISYQLRHPFWRRGLAGEAVALVRDWFFATTGEDLLIATTQQANLASQRLLERLGAVRAGSFEQYGLTQLRFDFHRPGHRVPCSSPAVTSRPDGPSPRGDRHD